ncbi:MAG: YbaB/EbfC family nucleoid-associated protein [Bacilli bacterium]|nr:YbaB/EbfC family nucleoid-associated protein [Bacilli bacterium]
MNQQAMLRKIQKMQKEMMDTQKQIEETVFTASAGGVVSVDMYGTKEIKEVRIDPDFEAEGKEDYEMLSDMIVAASKEAYRQIDKTTQEKMGKYQALLGGMGGGLF